MIPVIINDVPLICINAAAVSYHVPATLILSVLKKENGRNGEARKNKNGTFDYGPFQINSIWIEKIASFGFTKEDIQFDPCKNANVATWLIAKGLAEGKNLLSAIGNFHSHTTKYNQSYGNSVYDTHKKINEVISI